MPQISNENPSENREKFDLTSIVLNEKNFIGGYKDGLIILWNTVKFIVKHK